MSLDRRLLGVACIGLGACSDLVGVEERRYVGDDSSASSSPNLAASSSSSTQASQGSTGGAGGGDAIGSGGIGGTGTVSVGGGAGGCSSDVDDDPHNCGACGHDCLGGDCAGGGCRPVEVVAAQPAASYRSLRVDRGPGGQLVFLRYRPSAAVFVADKAPGAAVFTVAELAADGWAHSAAIDDTWIYFSNFTDHDSDPVRGVYAVRRAGGAPVQLARDDAATRILGTAFIEVDGADVFFATYFGTIAIGRTGHGGVPVLPVWSLPEPGPYYVQGGTFALDDEWVYADSAVEGVQRHRRDGTESESIYPEAGAANVIAVREGLAYWLRYDARFERGPIDGSGPIEVIATGVTFYTLPIVEGDHAYYLAAEGTEIRRKSLFDLTVPPDLVVSGITGNHLASDGVSLFWMAAGTGRVMRLAL